MTERYSRQIPMTNTPSGYRSQTVSVTTNRKPPKLLCWNGWFTKPNDKNLQDEVLRLTKEVERLELLVQETT